MQFELFRAEEVKSNAQSEQTTSVRQDKKVSLTIKNYKIMTQMNEMSARALSMEELENVNGGKVTIQDILKSTTAILMFGSSGDRSSK